VKAAGQRGAGGQEAVRGERPERHLHLDGRGYRLRDQPRPQHQIGQDADPQHADRAAVAGLPGPPGQLVDGRLAGRGQLVGHAGDQLADPVPHRPARDVDRPVRPLPAPVGGGRVAGGQLLP
jgi:hypothetical protein